MTLGTVSTGSILIAVGFPQRLKAVELLAQQFIDGSLRAWIENDGQMHVEILEGDGATHSAAVDISGTYRAGINAIYIGWSEGQIVSVRMNGSGLYPEAFEKSEFDEAQNCAPVPRDFSDESRSAQLNRKQKLAGFVRNPKRIPGGIEYVFEALRTEVELLQDSIEKVEQGSKAHVMGMMARVRLCVIGKPLGLLSVCAAHLDAPLTVFTSNHAGGKFPISPVTQIMFDISEKSEGPLYNPIDLDAWLDLTGLQLDEKEYPNREVIREIGNTVASHLDMDIQPSVFFLKSGKTNFEIEMDHLKKYCLGVAKAVFALSKNLVQLYGNRSR